jgi:upstream activation factor subunit UAF30
VVSDKKAVAAPKKAKTEAPKKTKAEAEVAAAPVAPPKELQAEKVEATVDGAVAEGELALEPEFKSVLTDLTSCMNMIKALQTKVRGLEKHCIKQTKDLAKKMKGGKRSKKAKAAEDGDKPKRAPSGFAKPSAISNDLCVFLGEKNGTFMSRTDVTKRITSYIREQKLQNPANRKEIVPDMKLKKLLNPTAGDVVTYFNLQTYMKGHFLKPPVVATA